MPENQPQSREKRSKPEELWALFAERARRDPSIPFEEHLLRFQELGAACEPGDPPPAAWRPDPGSAAGSNIGRFMRERGLDRYPDLHRWSTRERGEFWSAVLERLGIVFSRPPRRTLDSAGGPLHPRWLPEAELNITDSCFKGEPDRAAVIWRGESGTGGGSVSYGELEGIANRVAAGLRGMGIAPGEAVALFMPMTVECVAAYLGTVRAGCAVVSIADSFAAGQVASRMKIGQAAAVLTMDGYERAGKRVELYTRIRETGGPTAVVVPSDPVRPPELREGDRLWEEFLEGDGRFESVPSDPYGVTNILFSSGTTGDPKAIPWTHLTPIKAAMDGHFHQDIGPSDVVAWPTNVGWMMGPWLIYATLINGATMALHDGVPTRPGFIRFVEEAGVTILGLVPALVRAWRSIDPWPADWSRVRVMSSTGEPSNREDYLWLMSRAGYRAPVIEYCGGTEIGGGYISGTVVQPASPATFTSPALGLDLVLLDESGREAGEGEAGEVFLVPPSIGLSQSLLNRDHEETYHAGCPRSAAGSPLRRHGDRMRRLPGGFYEAEGRADDTMNLGGIKVGSLELERVAGRHDAVKACAAVSVRPGGGPEALVLFVVPSRKADPLVMRKEIQTLISKDLNPLFRVHEVVITDGLPYTATNKLMRRELRARYESE